MTDCDYCKLSTAGGWHSPGWCLDYCGPEQTVRVPIARPAVVEAVDRDERNRRYRAKVCVDCGQGEPAPARPRCWPCHDRRAQLGEPALSPRRIEPCASCARPGAVPGNVLCGPCRRERP